MNTPHPQPAIPCRSTPLPSADCGKLGNLSKAVAAARQLTPNQRRLVLALPSFGMKKWRAQYRHGKVRGWTQLPFAVARPSLTGYELLTDFGRDVKAVLVRGLVVITEPRAAQ